MSNVISMEEARPDTQYYTSDDGDSITGVGHSNSILGIIVSEFNEDNVCVFYKDSREVAQEMSKKEFNMMLMSWLLISDPQLIDDFHSSNDESLNED